MLGGFGGRARLGSLAAPRSSCRTGFRWQRRFPCCYSCAVTVGRKRFTSAAHLWLGIALSLSPICAWVAIRGVAAIAEPADLLTPFVLAAAVAAWVTGFDIIYACQDAEHDAAVGLHSIPSKFGIAGALRIAAGAHVVMLEPAGVAADRWPIRRIWLVILGCTRRNRRFSPASTLACQAR